MRKAILIDKQAGKVYNLTELVSKSDEEEVTIGRHEDNVIQLGANSDDNLTSIRNVMIRGSFVLSTVSNQHATIRYGWGEMGEGFYIRDHSKNGTKIEGYLISLEKAILKKGDEILFGAYGPVIYEEVEEAFQEAIKEDMERKTNQTSNQ